MTRRVFRFYRRPEVADEGAQDAERRGQMHVENRVPLVVGHLLDHAVPGVAGVVDEDVAAAEAVDRGLDDALAEVGRGDVAVARCRARTQRFDQRQRLLAPALRRGR